MQMIEILIEGLDNALKQMGTKQLKKPYRDEWDSATPRAGFCYVIAEVIYYYLNPGGFTPRVITWDNGTTHWFLANDAGDIIDPGNLDNFPWDNYRTARKQHFRTTTLSKRGKILADLLGFTMVNDLHDTTGDEY